MTTTRKTTASKTVAAKAAKPKAINSGAAKPRADKPRAATPRAVASKQPDTCLLRLYVAGTTAQSTRAILNIQNICEEYLDGAYQLEVIDIYQRPQLAKDEQIIAVPTLVKKLPLPLRRVIGNFSDSERVLIGLDLRGNPKK